MHGDNPFELSCTCTCMCMYMYTYTYMYMYMYNYMQLNHTQIQFTKHCTTQLTFLCTVALSRWPQPQLNSQKWLNLTR